MLYAEGNLHASTMHKDLYDHPMSVAAVRGMAYDTNTRPVEGTMGNVSHESDIYARMQDGQSSYAIQPKDASVFPHSSTTSTRSTAAMPKPPDMPLVCKCSSPYAEDGRTITCIACRRLFHMACCLIHANNAGMWRCWDCFSGRTTGSPLTSPAQYTSPNEPCLSSGSATRDTRQSDARQPLSATPSLSYNDRPNQTQNFTGDYRAAQFLIRNSKSQFEIDESIKLNPFWLG